MSFDFDLAAAVGCDVRSEYESWTALVGQYAPFYLAGRRFGPANLQLTGVSLSDTKLDNLGRILTGKITIKLTEYAEEASSKKASSGKSSSSGKSGSSSKSAAGIATYKELGISWAASTDPDGNLSGYVLERKVGSGTWAQIYKGSSRSYTDAITYGWTSVQYRVKAYDAAGAESAYTTSVTRTVTNNRPPVISGTDGALGSFSTAAPSYEYTVTDADGHQVDVVEMLDGVTLRSYTVTLGHTNTLTIGSEAWLKVVNGSHTLKIVATDAKDASVTRTLTFTKAVTSVEFEQTLAMEADAMPTKALVNIQGNFPAGCTLQVWICNNGNDASPTWEDITQKARTGQKHYFTNQTKTAAAWGVKVKAKLLRGSATETCYIQSIGGNFA